MTVDPSDPETFEDESDTPYDVEAPEDDTTADEQPTDVDPSKANEADVVEQARVVSLDEDDYR
ncbi:hypothetical protein OG496_36490 [Streptomyces sp. NBC_00988]|uniref:hypothetical protein n=1 Tax=Streptomyces sp. NBC_00988 TaxID=2903704 RepID=UPI003869B661|nr:hypothetical protein OG496_36490 [Streptomyces sp. NBC_00988]